MQALAEAGVRELGPSVGHIPHLAVKDLHEVAAAEIPAADLYWASFPCQDHSGAGVRERFQGSRGVLIFDFLGLEAKSASGSAASPLVALENVMGLIPVDGGGDFAAVATALASAGYRLGALRMDAADFLPQSRPRLFIVGVRDGVPPAKGELPGAAYPALACEVHRARRSRPAAVGQAPLGVVVHAD